MQTHSPAQGIVDRPPDDVPHYHSLLDLAADRPPIDWLWPDWIPCGMLTLLAAAPGTGKSLVALDLARRVIAGLPLPDGAPVPCPGSNVLLVDAEGPLSLLDQRAQAWDIDRGRLFLMLHEDRPFFDLASSPQQKVLANMIRHLQPSLLIIDSLGAATPGGEAGRTGLHILLAALRRLAIFGNLAVLLIHHFRKRTYSGSSPAAPVTVDDLRGSSHIVATARSILTLSPVANVPVFGEVPDPPPTRRLEVIKSNLCRLPPPLGLVLEGGDAGAPILHYTGPILTQPPLPSQLELCAHWLLDYLTAADEPVRPADLLQAAVEAGFSQATLYRARRALGPQILGFGTGAHDPARRWSLTPTAPAKP